MGMLKKKIESIYDTASTCNSFSNPFSKHLSVSVCWPKMSMHAVLSIKLCMYAVLLWPHILTFKCHSNLLRVCECASASIVLTATLALTTDRVYIVRTVSIEHTAIWLWVELNLMDFQLIICDVLRYGRLFFILTRSMCCVFFDCRRMCCCCFVLCVFLLQFFFCMFLFWFVSFFVPCAHISFQINDFEQSARVCTSDRICNVTKW